MNLTKREKGSHKDYSYWLSTELNDYVCKADHNDPLEKYNTLLSETTNQAQDEENDSNPIYCVSKKKKAKRAAKTVQNIFTFLPNITKLPIQALTNLSSFLHVKDVVGLSMTCKQLNTSFSEGNIWKTLCRRDFDIYLLGDEQLILMESAKHFYKYQIYQSKPGIIHHTGVFWKHGVPLASKLGQSVVDFVSPKHLAIRESLYVLNLRNDSKIGNILKLSWLRQENEVWLWFSGQGLVKWEVEDKKRERLMAHVLRVYRGLDGEVVQNAFFLEDRYIVIQVVAKLSQEDVEEEDLFEAEKEDEVTEKSASTWIIYDLENELQRLVTEEDGAAPLRYSFIQGIVEDANTKDEQEQEGEGEKKGEEEEKCLENEREIEVESELIAKNKNDENVIKVKLLNEQEALFYETNTISPLIKIISLKTRNESYSTKMELSSPIKDIIFLKNPSLSERNSFYIIDQTLNVYQSAWSNNNLVLLKSITFPKDEEALEEEDLAKTQEKKRYLGMCLYSQGVYNKPGKDRQNVVVEYLIVNKRWTFYFIELDTLEVHHYKSESFANWTTNEDKLFLVSGTQTFVYQFSFRDFHIKELGIAKANTYIKPGYISQAIFINACHTIQIVCYKNPHGGGDLFDVFFGSTQFLLSATQLKTTYGKIEEYDITGLLKKQRKRILPLLPQNQFEIRFDDKGLFLKSPFHTVLFELENYWKNFSVSNKWDAGYKKISFSDMIDPVEEMKNTDKIETVPLVTQFEKVPVNKNNEGKKEKNTNKWTNKGNKGNKEENKEKRIIRHKGEKYRKNVQQNQRSEKCE